MHTLALAPKGKQKRRHPLQQCKDNGNATSKLGRWVRGFALILLGLGWGHAAPAAETTTYVLTDAQGTVLAREDAHGRIIARYDYRPYGKQQTGPAAAGPGYTGHVGDPDTKFVYMQQRYYDPEIGRFLSVDPVDWVSLGLFNTNRYMYSNGNPIANIDPDGRVVVSANSANNARIAEYINSRSSQRFVFNNNNLEKADGASSGESNYYADRISAAITSDKTLVINIAANHTGESGEIYNVNSLGGGGLTEERSNGDVVTTISGDGNFVYGADGSLIYEGPEDILAHEVVGHAVPGLGLPDTGNAVTNENKERAENHLPLRKPDPSHKERQSQPTIKCGILCER